MNASGADRMLITFWGTRGSISTPGRATEKYGGNTPCVFIRYGDIRIIFDAGTGIRGLGLLLAREMEGGKDPAPLHLFLSHTHWDHIQGLPFFKPAYRKGARITIYGSSNKERFLENVLKRQMDMDYFPVGLSDMAADIRIREMSDETVVIGPVVVDWQEQVFHPGGSVRYRLSAGGKRVVYATDVELDRIVRPEKEDADSARYVQEYLEFIEDADLLIADGQYTAEEYGKKAEWGHTSIPVIIGLARRAGVRQLAIFHHDPQHSDGMIDRLWKECQDDRVGGGLTEIFWAREGMTLPV
ncbi:MAG: MBL fold metallo-hydrolase [Deltaproteobacteria bacterium]|nr:MAG: MBL fold metallo-hydrolase [Deltaproteobacteria bacterium]